jgi:hypothetical protein
LQAADDCRTDVAKRAHKRPSTTEPPRRTTSSIAKPGATSKMCQCDGHGITT